MSARHHENPGADAASSARQRNTIGLWLRDLDWQTIFFILALKAIVLGFAVISLRTLTDERLEWATMWNRWDAVHYLSLAKLGYQSTGEERFSIVFFPLYPWLVRGTHWLVRDYLHAAFAVSAAASVTAGLLLQKLTRLDAGVRVSGAAVWFLFIFPTSYFLHIGYTESLFLALVLGCVLAARQDRWFLAGALGACASLTRINGLLLMPVLAVEVWERWRVARRIDWRWLWIAVVPLGFAVYLAVNYQATGDPFAFSKIMEQHWYKKLAPPWRGIIDVWHRQTFAAFSEWFHELLFIALGFGMTLWCWVRLRLSYAVWMTLNWLLVTSTAFVVSVPRYLLTLFPMFILLAHLSARRPRVGMLVSACSLLLLAVFVTRFAQGVWAF